MAPERLIRRWPVVMAAGGLVLVLGTSAWAWPCPEVYERHGGFGRRHRTTIFLSARPVSRDVLVVPAAAAAPAAAQTVVINVPNANGSYTPVVLQVIGGQYVGPKGEHYLNLPTVEQLKPVYGLQ